MTVTPDMIIAAVTSYYGLKDGNLRGPRRWVQFATPRAVGMYLDRHLTRPQRSFPQIGRDFGGRDHSTVITAVRKVEGWLRTDWGMVSAVAEICAQLGVAVPALRPVQAEQQQAQAVGAA